MSKFQFGDKVMVNTFNNAGKYGTYTFTVKGYLVLGGKLYDDLVEVFPNEHLRGHPKYGLYFPEKNCRLA